MKRLKFEKQLPKDIFDIMDWRLAIMTSSIGWLAPTAAGCHATDSNNFPKLLKNIIKKRHQMVDDTRRRMRLKSKRLMTKIEYIIVPLFMLSAVVYQTMHSVQMVFVQLIGAFEAARDPAAASAENSDLG